MRLAVLKLASGNLWELEIHLRLALTDFRDAIAAAEYPKQLAIGFTGMASRSGAELDGIKRQDSAQYQSWLHRPTKAEEEA